MPFSMTTYFAGVGTVVGALALGFGGGIVLTNTAIKDTPAACYAFGAYRRVPSS
jgi:hypothetical protein